MTFPVDKPDLDANVGTSTTPLSDGHVDHHQELADNVEGLMDKVGIDSSATNTTHDFKLSGVADGDKAGSLTGTETFTNKTLTSPVINVTSDAEGDVYYRDGSGNFARLAIGSANNVLQVNAGATAPEWAAASTVTSDEKDALAGTSGTPSTSNKYVTNDDTSDSAGSGKVVRATGTALPALDGSNLTDLPTKVKTEVFTSSGTWTRPSDVDQVRVVVVGGGGAGGGVSTAGNSAGGGGGAGGYAEADVVVSGNVTVTIGAAGAGSSGSAGGNGGNSSFAGDTTITANGGTGGALGNGSTAAGGAGGSTTNGEVDITGQTGQGGLQIGATELGGFGGSNPYGQGGYMNTDQDQAGTNANGYGGGGGGASGAGTARAGGNGTAGLVIVYWVAG